MTREEFIEAADEAELTERDRERVTRLLDLVEYIVGDDVLLSGIYACRLIVSSEVIGTDPMNVVAFVEGDLAETYEAPEPDYFVSDGFEVDDEGYLFWGLR